MKRTIVVLLSVFSMFLFCPAAAAHSGGITVGENLPVKPAFILVGMFIGAVVAVFSVFHAKNKLKSVSFQREADSYIKNGSFLLTESTDRLIDTKTTRSLRTKNSGILDELRKD